MDEILSQLPAHLHDRSSETALKAVALARLLQERATKLQTPAERHQQEELERMVQHASDKATLTQITDQAFRSADPDRSADQLVHILDIQGIPRFFGWMDRALLKGFQNFGSHLPGVAVPLVKEKMRDETANVILPAEEDLLKKHLKERSRTGIRMNVNFLGEALLGEAEAEERLHKYLNALQLPEIEVLSVKISTLYSQINPLAREETLEVLCERMELLFRAARRARYRRADGTEVSKFVYLDMEEYRDLDITAQAFMRTLDRPGLQDVRAGIALQAYIPDSFGVQKSITAWARKRVSSGGSPVTVRLVKGANMEMERVEASLMGWPQAPYRTKADTDANYKRMLLFAMDPENLQAVHVGVASHNLFDLALGLVLASQVQAADSVQFEMLEGMANHQRRALFEECQNVLLYAPATTRKGFINAIGYLIRRLDENTGPDNFLRHAFKIKVDSAEWKRLEEQFLDAYEAVDTVFEGSRRTQDRSSEEAVTLPPESPFANEPDTDWSLPHHSTWARDVRNRWQARSGERPFEVPIVVGGSQIFKGRETRERTDPSRPGVIASRCAMASATDVAKALATAAEDPSQWRKRSHEDRARVFALVARELRAARGELMGAAMLEGGKIFTESDPEVSEAIDFVEYYIRSVQQWKEDLGAESLAPVGVVAVIPPWNFPIAIPCGGIAAALAAGNTVLLKPAPETPLTAWLMCECFWRAGVPREALQFVPCIEETEGTAIITDPRVNRVVLTGGTDTAQLFLNLKPDMQLLAETGGKNATIVTALSDREQAVKNVIHSAFGHAGQKCSATSLLVLETEVYEDPDFKRMLIDAVSSMRVGSAWDLDTRIGPCVHPPRGPLDQALHELEPGESWALLPRRLQGIPNLWSPGIKWDVQPDSFTHATEFFGPVLGVMKAENLEEACRLVNQTGFGLTSGLESLDDREQKIWKSRIRAGNLYINRGTTGAIVQRQPFGGMGKSAFGPGSKAGGPNYVAHFISPQVRRFAPDSATRNLPARFQALGTQLEGTGSSTENLANLLSEVETTFETVFAEGRDASLLLGQDNILRYLPAGKVLLRLTGQEDAEPVLATVAGALVTGNQVHVSVEPGSSPAWAPALHALLRSEGDSLFLAEQPLAQVAQQVREGYWNRIRVLDPRALDETLRREANVNGVYVGDAPFSGHARFDLLMFLQEQSLSMNYHRYGNLGLRGGEQRASVQ